MNDTVRIPIASCKSCPHHRSEREHTGDAFEEVMKWSCAHHDVRLVKKEFQVIGYEEWPDTPAIPSWCPFRKVDN